MNRIVMALLTTLLSFLSCHRAPAPLEADAFESLLASGEIRLVDVRTPEEYAEGHLYGALNADWYAGDFLSQVQALVPEGAPVAVYCRSGRRSAEAAAKLRKSGYSTVYDLKGGYLGWTEAGKRTNCYEVESFTAPSGFPVTLTLIKHGSVEIGYRGVSIQIDPVSGLGKPTDYAAEFPKAGVILVTHEHGDHLDDAAIQALTGPETLLLLNGTSARQIGRGEIIGNGEKRELPGGIGLEAVPAYNTTPGREMFHPQGNGNGYVLTFDGLRVYVAGDTEDVPEMEQLKDIDVALLPVNQPYTMTVEQCAHATRVIRPGVLIPYHFSSTDLSPMPGLLPGQKILFRQMQ
jgi:L-ascorbate metabolism protein UlaG (beta-lactamase superfamily)/rhodanese-related sulfurtransferase